MLNKTSPQGFSWRNNLKAADNDFPPPIIDSARALCCQVSDKPQRPAR
jgi:hypothetical protein